jgi:ribosome-binding ATPase YchF (GTP1/OBG family)
MIPPLIKPLSRDSGKLRVEGKEYVMLDEDLMHF